MQKIALTKGFLEMALKELNQSGMETVQLFPDTAQRGARIAQHPYSSGSHPMCGYVSKDVEDRDYGTVLTYTTK